MVDPIILRLRDELPRVMQQWTEAIASFDQAGHAYISALTMLGVPRPALQPLVTVHAECSQELAQKFGEVRNFAPTVIPRIDMQVNLESAARVWAAASGGVGVEATALAKAAESTVSPHGLKKNWEGPAGGDYLDSVGLVQDNFEALAGIVDQIAMSMANMEDNVEVYNLAQAIALSSFAISGIMAGYACKTALLAPLTEGGALVPAAVEAIIAIAGAVLAMASVKLGDLQLDVAGRVEGRSIDKVALAAEAWGAVSSRVGDGARYPR